MAEKALDFIREAENKARDIIDKAHAEAAEMVDNAAKKAEQDLVDTEEASALSGEKMLAEAAERGEANSAKYSEETGLMAETLKHRLDERREQAIGIVINTIMQQ